MSTTIAVIISTYNARETLSRVLDAYQTQTMYPNEVIVADDGSSDGTAEMVREHCARSAFPIRHVSQEDNGFRLARIRNLAIKECQSDYVVFTDGDCMPHLRFVEDHARLMEHGYFVQGKRMFIAEEASKTFSYQGTCRLLAQCARGEAHGMHHLIRWPGLARVRGGLRGIRTANFALFREDFTAVNGFNEDFVGWGREDSELVVRLYKYGLQRKNALCSALVFHLWHPENTRAAVSKNEQLLQAAIEAPNFRCRNGIDSEAADK